MPQASGTNPPVGDVTATADTAAAAEYPRPPPPSRSRDTEAAAVAFSSVFFSPLFRRPHVLCTRRSALFLFLAVHTFSRSATRAILARPLRTRSPAARRFGRVISTPPNAALYYTHTLSRYSDPARLTISFRKFLNWE